MTESRDIFNLEKCQGEEDVGDYRLLSGMKVFMDFLSESCPTTLPGMKSVYR
jgi:hypothetical protein